MAGLKVLNFLTFFDEGDDVGAGSKDYASQLASGTGFNQNLAQITRKFSLLFSVVGGGLTDTLNSNIIGADQIQTNSITPDKFNSSVASVYSLASDVATSQAAQDAATAASQAAQDGAVAASQAVQDLALATHKTSGDHDSRYLSVSYLSSLVRTSFNLTIDGIKTFLKNVLISNAAPALELRDTSGNALARIWAAIGSPNVMRLSIGESGSWKELLEVFAGQTQVNFPNHNVAAKGLQLATQAYVDDQVASVSSSSSGNGSPTFAMANSIWVDPIPSTWPFTITLMRPTMTLPFSVLSEVRYAHFTEDQIVDTKHFPCSVQFADATYNMIKVELGIGTEGEATLTVSATHVALNSTSGTPPTWTAIANNVITEGGTYVALGGAEGFLVTLKFGMAV